MKSKKTTALSDLFLDEIKDIYWAENALAKALTKMAKSATNEELSSAFLEHQQVTQTHIERLDKVFNILGEKPSAKKCEAMSGLLEESNSVIEDTEKDTFVRDVGLIICAQKVEHYEISAYGSLRTLAQVLDQPDVARLFQATLEEETQTDKKLSAIAIGFINEQALHEGEVESKGK